MLATSLLALSRLERADGFYSSGILSQFFDSGPPSAPVRLAFRVYLVVTAVLLYGTVWVTAAAPGTGLVDTRQQKEISDLRNRREHHTTLQVVGR